MVVEMTENLRQIVNGKLIPQYSGKKVSVTGLVTNVEPNGLSFNMKTVDDVDIKVNVKKPIRDALSGYVEVHGIAQGKSVACENIIQFAPEECTDFDAAAHDTLCSLLNVIPDLWKTK